MRFTLLLLALIATTAQAIYKVSDSDFKYPTTKNLKVRTITGPDSTAANEILNDHAGATAAAAVTVSSFSAQPDVARLIQVVPGGTTADVASGSVVVTGRNIYGEVITDTFNFGANQSTAERGTKAFASVTSILFPAEDSPYGATWDVGYLNELGLNACMDFDGVVAPIYNSAWEATRPTVSYDADEVEKNYVKLSTALNGSASAVIHFLENFRCYPHN